MRPSVIMVVATAVVVALGGLALGLGAFVDRNGGKFWFYWIAPLLTLGLGGLVAMLVVGYYVKVGRLETKGRPRSD